MLYDNTMSKDNGNPNKDNLEKGLKWLQGHSQELSLAAAAAARAAAKKRKASDGADPLLKVGETVFDRASSIFGNIAEKAAEEAVEAGLAKPWSPVKVLVAGIAIGFAIGFLAGKD